MDTIADFAKRKLGNNINIDRFFIAGASKVYAESLFRD